jgi:hypothetical protein
MKKKIHYLQNEIKQNRFYLARIKEIDKYFDVTLFTNGFSTKDKSTYDVNIVFRKKLINKKYPIINHLNILYFTFQNIFYFLRNPYDCIIVHITPFTWLYPLFLDRKKIILQLSTTDVSENFFKRLKKDFFNIKIPTIFFKYVFVQTEWMAKKINIPINKYFVINPGFEAFTSSKNHIPKNIELIYIGVLHNRDIYKTISGLGLFLNKHPIYRGKIKYHIIGSGNLQTLSKIRSEIKNSKTTNEVIIHGYLIEKELENLIQRSSIAVGFVPIVPYYTNVTSSKTYEYLLTGFPVIATETIDNKKVINEDNGVLCKDTPESFAIGIEEIVKKLPLYDINKIKASAKMFSNEEIIKSELVPAIEKIINS